MLSDTFSQSLMGIFFWIHSVALVEDLNVKEPSAYCPEPPAPCEDTQPFVNAMEASYNQVKHTALNVDLDC